MNVWEDENRWYVEAELPGTELEDLEITVCVQLRMNHRSRRRT